MTTNTQFRELDNGTQDQFIRLINQTRKANKNNWYSMSGWVGDTLYRLKGFNTWIQRIEAVDKAGHIIWKDTGPADCSVKQFNDYLHTITS